MSFLGESASNFRQIEELSFQIQVLKRTQVFEVPENDKFFKDFFTQKEIRKLRGPHLSICMW